MVLVRVDDHSVHSIPCICYLNFALYAQVKGDRITVTVVQLLVVCVCMKFHLFDVLEKVAQEDVALLTAGQLEYESPTFTLCIPPRK